MFFVILAKIKISPTSLRFSLFQSINKNPAKNDRDFLAIRS
jgi:hypothetical protein